MFFFSGRVYESAHMQQIKTLTWYNALVNYFFFGHVHDFLCNINLFIHQLFGFPDLGEMMNYVLCY